ncbi:hypothetical protein [Massilia cavernae]|uniref:hypothetical protein n=1 Tax=Massilia cavernae TaxID=2320864 RepID=UPI0011C37D89|nr:hypothetical protein [Massilia cavernae]
MYEIAVPGRDGPTVSNETGGYLNGCFIVLLTASALIAAGGALFPTAIKVSLDKPWFRHYQALATSVVLTSLAAGGYAVIHYGLLKP